GTRLPARMLGLRTPKKERHHERLPRPPRRRPDATAFALALARQVVVTDSAHRLPDLPLDRLRARDDRRVLRDPLHRPLPAGALRLQRRRPALDLARL